MTRPASAHLSLEEIRGIARLATDATVGVTGIAEGVHQSVWSVFGRPGGRTPGRARGITGLVYSSVRGVSSIVGKGVDLVLGGLQSLVESEADSQRVSRRRESILAVLNGVIGDHLVATDNPLATPMSLRYRGAELDWQQLPPIPEATGRIVVLVHGLCMSDLQWRTLRDGRVVDHGQAVASALGSTPLYLRYNSGLSTSDNGHELSALLERLAIHWPIPIEEIAVVAHSMGGLVIRSAFHHGEHDALSWPRLLKRIVFLGTPHHGAPLERIGSWVETLLRGSRFTTPFAALGMMRSAGIMDLRYGSVVATGQRGGGPESFQVVALPEQVACFAVAATTRATNNPVVDDVLGDGLVPVSSALGRHDDADRCLAFGADSQMVVHRTSHMGLLSSPRVNRQIIDWLTPARA